jgi:ABC-2 type transport system permease protein
MFTWGVGLILSVYAVFFRDLIHLFGIILTVWTYLTPIFYPISIIPEKYQIFIKLNPLYYFIEHFRQVILYARVPSLSLNFTCLSISVITVLIGVLAFYKKQDRFTLFI